MLRLILITFFCANFCLHAADKPLDIAVENYIPPFVMHGSSSTMYGFDIDMMNSLCAKIHRTCRYHIMPFDELLKAVATKKVDIAISAIIITPERSRIVNFSLPYLTSYSRFLARKSSENETISTAMLNSKKIGLEKGSTFYNELMSMGVKSSNIEEFKNVSDELAGLTNKEVDLILLDDPSAVYWSSNSSDDFRLLGDKNMYGDGLGIAVNPSEVTLLNEINNALLLFQNSKEFEDNYNKYLLGF